MRVSTHQRYAGFSLRSLPYSEASFLARLWHNGYYWQDHTQSAQPHAYGFQPLSTYADSSKFNTFIDRPFNEMILWCASPVKSGFLETKEDQMKTSPSRHPQPRKQQLWIIPCSYRPVSWFAQFRHALPHHNTRNIANHFPKKHVKIGKKMLGKWVQYTPPTGSSVKLEN